MHQLVDAFYKGRAKLKKAQGQFFDNPTKPKKACAIGAIYYGLYNKGAENYGLVDNIAGDYPELRQWVKVAPCEDNDGGGTVSGILVHLNDEHTGHDWPDKKIADWLEQTLASPNV